MTVRYTLLSGLKIPDIPLFQQTFVTCVYFHSSHCLLCNSNNPPNSCTNCNHRWKFS